MTSHPDIDMRDNIHAGVNTTGYSILFDHQLTNLFNIESFSGGKHAGKALIIFNYYLNNRYNIVPL